ncbi:hypothetical protein TrispH2_006878 [Trichoplax sp. H2]|nr:hypothetical protein TrispH2_006878 [Trichoplax sp. H2]|eukprot:RDD40973.1 hypothetical protein TrispH2_006878 [Trichoplax sp. H2]
MAKQSSPPFMSANRKMFRPQDNNNPHRSNNRRESTKTSLVITRMIIIINILRWLLTTLLSLLFALGIKRIGYPVFAAPGTLITLLFPANGLINAIVFTVLIHMIKIKRQKARFITK